MAQPDPIDATLAELREDLAHCLTLLNICVQLRRNSSHLLTLLGSMLIDLREQIDQATEILPAEEGERHA